MNLKGRSFLTLLDFTPEEIKVFYRVFDVICERLKESEDIIDSDVENISKARKRRV